MRQPIIAGNWKMHKTAAEAKQFIESLHAKTQEEQIKADIVICVPFTALASAVEAARGTAIKIGAQNMHWEEKGAFTGEVSPTMLQEIGVDYVIIGHSERRAYFAETDITVNKKVLAAFNHGIRPIVCVGEDLGQYEANETKNVVRTQTEKAIEGLTPQQVKDLVIAYEPIWAIGTGKSSSSTGANDVIRYIREVVSDLFDEETAQAVRIQYGGSVKPENIREYMGEADIDGALVGGASLEPDSFWLLALGTNA